MDCFTDISRQFISDIPSSKDLSSCGVCTGTHLCVWAVHTSCATGQLISPLVEHGMGKPSNNPSPSSSNHEQGLRPAFHVPSHVECVRLCLSTVRLPLCRASRDISLRSPALLVRRVTRIQHQVICSLCVHVHTMYSLFYAEHAQKHHHASFSTPTPCSAQRNLTQ